MCYVGSVGICMCVLAWGRVCEVKIDGRDCRCGVDFGEVRLERKFRK